MSFSIDNINSFDINNAYNLNIIKDDKVQSFEKYLNKANKDNKEDLKFAAKDFEAYFINMIFKQMRSTINYSNGIFKRSKAEEIFQEMLDEQISKESTKFGGIGIADEIYKQLSNNNI